MNQTDGHDFATPDGLLQEIERRGASVWLEDVPGRTDELHISGLDRLPRPVTDAVLEAAPEIIADIKELLWARASATESRLTV